MYPTVLIYRMVLGKTKKKTNFLNKKKIFKKIGHFFFTKFFENGIGSMTMPMLRWGRDEPPIYLISTKHTILIKSILTTNFCHVSSIEIKKDHMFNKS